MFKTKINLNLPRKKILLVLFMLIVSSVALLGEVPPLTPIDNIHLREAVYDYELIQEYEFDEPLKQVYFTKPKLNDSGTLSLIAFSRGRLGGLPITRLVFDENLNYEKIGDDSLGALISPHGEYIMQTKYGSTRMDCKILNKSGREVGTFGKDYPPDFGSKSLDPLNVTNINDNGIILYSESTNDKYKLFKDMTVKKVGHFYNEESLKHLIPGEYARMSALSLNGNFAILASENHYLGLDKYFTFPLGSRVFFYDENANFIKSHDIEGTKEMCWPFKFSDSGKYFIMQSEPYMYLFKDGELVMKEDVVGIGNIRFSEDESVLLVGTGVGSLIIDLNTCKIIKNLRLYGGLKEIANIDYPIIACMGVNEVYVVNYETEEVMLTEIIGPKYPTHYRVNNLQISGDGETVTLFHYKWFRKYRLGGKK